MEAAPPRGGQPPAVADPADHEPEASWICERATRHRWTGTGTRTRTTDGALDFDDGHLVGIELELHVKAAHRSTSELVTRLDPAGLERPPGHPVADQGPMKGRLGDVALRALNLAASLSPAWDRGLALDAVDVAVFTLPILDNVKDSDAAMRVLVAAYAQHSASGPAPALRAACSRA